MFQEVQLTGPNRLNAVVKPGEQIITIRIDPRIQEIKVIQRDPISDTDIRTCITDQYLIILCTLCVCIRAEVSRGGSIQLLISNSSLSSFYTVRLSDKLKGNPRSSRNLSRVHYSICR